MMDTLTKLTSIRNQLDAVNSKLIYGKNSEEETKELEANKLKLFSEYHEFYKKRIIEVKPNGTDIIIWFKKHKKHKYYSIIDSQVHMYDKGAWIETDWKIDDLKNPNVTIAIQRELIWEKI